MKRTIRPKRSTILQKHERGRSRPGGLARNAHEAYEACQCRRFRFMSNAVTRPRQAIQINEIDGALRLLTYHCSRIQASLESRLPDKQKKTQCFEDHRQRE